MSRTSDERDSLTHEDMMKIHETRAAARARFAHLPDGGDGDVRGAVDPDNPPMTEAQLAGLRPAAEVVPGLVSARLRREGGRPMFRGLKVDISLRLDPDVVEALQSSGEDWQDRANDLLRGALAMDVRRC